MAMSASVVEVDVVDLVAIAAIAMAIADAREVTRKAVLQVASTLSSVVVLVVVVALLSRRKAKTATDSMARTTPADGITQLQLLLPLSMALVMLLAQAGEATKHSWVSLIQTRLHTV